MLLSSLLLVFFFVKGLCMDCGSQKANYATCSIRSESGLTGTIDFAQIAPLGCFGPHDPIEIMVSLTGFKTDDSVTQHALIVKEYGDLANGCQATGAIFRAHDDPNPTGFLANYEEGSSDVIKIDNTNAQLRGQNSIIGRSLVVLGGPYPSNTVPIGCCVIGVSDGSRFAGMPKPNIGHQHQAPFAFKTPPVHAAPIRSGGFFATHDPFQGRAKSLPFTPQDDPKPANPVFGFDLGNHNFGHDTFGHGFGSDFAGGSRLKPSISNLNQPPAPSHFPGDLHDNGSPLFGEIDGGSSVGKRFGFDLDDFTKLSDSEKHIPREGEETQSSNDGYGRGGGSSSSSSSSSNEGYGNDHGSSSQSGGYDGQSGGSQGLSGGYDGQSSGSQGSSGGYDGQSSGSQGSSGGYDGQSSGSHGSSGGYDGQSGGSQGLSGGYDGQSSGSHASSGGYDGTSSGSQGSSGGYDGQNSGTHGSSGGYDDQNSQGGYSSDQSGSSQSQTAPHQDSNHYAGSDNAPAYSDANTAANQDSGYDSASSAAATQPDHGDVHGQDHGTVPHGDAPAASGALHDPVHGSDIPHGSDHGATAQSGYQGQSSGTGYTGDDHGNTNNPYSSHDQGHEYASPPLPHASSNPISDPHSSAGGTDYATTNDAHVANPPHDGSHDIHTTQPHADHLIKDPATQPAPKPVLAKPLTLSAFNIDPSALHIGVKPTVAPHSVSQPSSYGNPGGSYTSQPGTTGTGNVYHVPPPPEHYNSGLTNPPHSGGSTSYTQPPTQP